MTLREQINTIVAALDKWARQRSGRAYAADGPVHVLELLRSAPGGVTAAILFDSEEPRGERSELGKVDRGFKVVISRGKGFQVDSGASLTTGSAGGAPLFDLVEEAREIVIALNLAGDTWDSEDQVAQYRGTNPFEVQGFVLDAYEIRFAAGAQNPTHYE